MANKANCIFSYYIIKCFSHAFNSTFRRKFWEKSGIMGGKGDVNLFVVRVVFNEHSLHSFCGFSILHFAFGIQNIQFNSKIRKLHNAQCRLTLILWYCYKVLKTSFMLQFSKLTNGNVIRCLRSLLLRPLSN